jgi:hypothetical protein
MPKRKRKNNWRRVRQNQWEGWWIFPDGNVREIVEHLNDIVAEPELYGYTPSQVKNWGKHNREKVLRGVMKRGFVRVRGHRTQRGGYTTFEFHRFTPRTKEYIRNFINKAGFWGSDRILLNELATGKHWMGFVRDAKPVFARGLIPQS